MADRLACQPLKPKKLAAAGNMFGTLKPIVSILSRTRKMQNLDPKECFRSTAGDNEEFLVPLRHKKNIHDTTYMYHKNML